jgi:DNA-binding CsgD family transcriptional regulator
MDDRAMRNDGASGAVQGQLAAVLSMLAGTASFAALAITVLLALPLPRSCGLALRLLWLGCAMAVAYVFSFAKPARALEPLMPRSLFAAALCALLVLMPLSGLLMAGQEPGALDFALWASHGAGMGLGVLLCGRVWNGFYRENPHAHPMYSMLAVTAMAAFSLCFSVVFAPRGFAVAATAVFAACTASCLVFNLSRCRLQGGAAPSSVRKHRLPLRAITHVSALGLYLGYCSARELSVPDGGLPLLLALPMFVLAALALLVIERHSQRGITFAFAGRIALPVGVSGALVAWLPDLALACHIQFALAVLGCSFFMLYHWKFITHWSVRYNVIATAQTAFGVIAPTTGMFAGWALQSVAVAFGLDGGLASWAMAGMMLFCYVLVSAIMPYGSQIRIADAERPLDGLAEDAGAWKTALAHLSDSFGLTARERDILALLARGRNIPFISSHLSISQHTVKTHVYRIYSKLEVGSQQELITLAEHCLEGLRAIAK